jgi:Ca-activated chloride channel family protein
MKLRRPQVALLILLLIVLGFLFELAFRPKVVSQSLAELLYKGKRYPSAEKIYTRNAKHGDSTASANLAKSLYKQGKFADAAKPSEAALSQAPNKSNYLFDNGNIAYKQGDYKAALEHYRKAMLQDPKDTDAKANYELTLKKLQNQPQKPPPQPDKEKDQSKKEEIRNILGGLDNKESSDRKQQNPQQGLPPTKWW